MKSVLFPLAFSLCVIGLALHGADGIWKVREGVGTGGTDWTLWSDPANWEGGVVAGADGNDCSANLKNAAAQYIRLPATLNVTNMGACGSSVFIGDGTYKFGQKTYTHNPYACYLYFPFSVAMKSGESYAGFGRDGDCNICDLATSASGTAALMMSAVSFRYDLFAKAAGETRSFTVWPNEIRMNADVKLRFIAPHGSSVALSSRWVQTAESPFLKLADGETPHVLSAGTTVTGDGIPEGAFLKRIFPDGSIELSAAPTTSAAANTLTFAAFNAKTEACLKSRLAAYNGKSRRYVYVQKYRAEDDMTLKIHPQIMQHLSGGADNNKWVFTTDRDFLPGRIVLSHIYGVATEPALVYLENCHLEIAASNSYGDHVALMVENAAHTARLTVTNNRSVTLGRLARLAGTIVKDGAGTLNMPVTNNTAAKITGSIVVEEGTFAPTFADAGTNAIASLTVKSGARFVIPGGVVLKPASLVVEDGAIFGGAGRLVCTGLSAAALRGLVFEGSVSIDDGRSGDEFSIEVLRGAPAAAAQDGDSVWIFGTNALLRVNGTGVFDVLLVGGGGGGGSKNGGGGGGGGVIYTQQMVVARGVYPLSVGMGGKGAPDKKTNNTSGGDSGVFGLLAYGGGAGGTYSRVIASGKVGRPLSGGSGGGGGTWYPGTLGSAAGADGVDGQGFAGGAATNGASHFWCGGGGGGGAGAPGGRTWTDGTHMYGGNGGDGVLCEIYGSKYYGGGGGGGSTSKSASTVENFRGGAGGGGKGGITLGETLYAGSPGEDGLGGGGGGGSGYVGDGGGGAGGDGGRGVVILRWRQPAPDENRIPSSDLAVGGAVRHRHGYAVHTFATDGEFDLSAPTLVDILLVGGGGGGGSRSGGGGGGGGVLVISNAYLISGRYSVTVGAGGAGAPGAGSGGTSGSDSVFAHGDDATYGLRAHGGGGGGSSGSGKAGGSGGGGGAPYTTWSTISEPAGAGIAGQGCAGGIGVHNYTGDIGKDWPTAQAGGGGGAGAPGGDATTSAPGNGGDGIYCDFSGEAVCYGGGGGGGSAKYGSAGNSYYIASGGQGGGGRGGAAYTPYPSTSAGENGVDGLGGGGGGSGGACDGANIGGDGGRGVVIIRYRSRSKGTLVIFK